MEKIFRHALRRRAGLGWEGWDRRQVVPCPIYRSGTLHQLISSSWIRSTCITSTYLDRESVPACRMPCKSPCGRTESRVGPSGILVLPSGGRRPSPWRLEWPAREVGVARSRNRYGPLAMPVLWIDSPGPCDCGFPRTISFSRDRCESPHTSRKKRGKVQDRGSGNGHT